jgi:hypothetical protein
MELLLIVGLEKLKNPNKVLVVSDSSMWLIQYWKMGFGWEKTI